MKAPKTPKNLKECHIHNKKSFFKENEIVLHKQRQMPQFHKLQNAWNWQKKNLPFTRLILEEQQKYLQSFISNATYHPMNPDADVTYQTVNLFSSDKCFIYFISDVPHYIRSNQHNTVCTILVKVDVLDTCGAMICSYFGIAFLLFFMKIENTVYTSFQNITLLFINGSIFDIMNIQNNQSFEFEWIPVLLRSVNDRSFSWIRNVFLKSFQLCSAMPRKLYKRCWSENVHIVVNIWRIGNKC